MVNFSFQAMMDSKGVSIFCLNSSSIPSVEFVRDLTKEIKFKTFITTKKMDSESLVVLQYGLLVIPFVSNDVSIEVLNGSSGKEITISPGHLFFMPPYKAIKCLTPFEAILVKVDLQTSYDFMSFIKSMMVKNMGPKSATQSIEITKQNVNDLIQKLEYSLEQESVLTDYQKYRDELIYSSEIENAK